MNPIIEVILKGIVATASCVYLSKEAHGITTKIKNAAKKAVEAAKKAAPKAEEKAEESDGPQDNA